MLILLPPSEGKTPGRRGRPLDLASLSFPSLSAHRAQLLAALQAVSARADAPAVLGVSERLRADLDRNATLTSAPTLPAIECYSGVLYDALAAADLDGPARRRLHRRVVIVSALYGAVRPRDRIAAYRLSMSVNLPGIGPLAAAWRPWLRDPLRAAAGSGLIVDCRSSTYAAAWVPAGELAQRWVQVSVRGATHTAKHTRGLVTRALCESAATPRTPHDLAEALREGFAPAIEPPQRPGRPWRLLVSAG